MPTYARRQIVVEDTVGVYHCIARCVRRACLCGVDPYTGQDYSHRKEWILDRMRELDWHYKPDQSRRPSQTRPVAPSLPPISVQPLASPTQSRPRGVCM